MNLDDIRRYCRKQRGKITEEFPFDETTLVFKVYGKIFVLVDVDSIPLSLNLKCDPENAVELRERYPFITAGYHMNKRYWNTVEIENSVSESLLYGLIEHSYDEVVRKLPSKLKVKIYQTKVKKKVKKDGV